MFDFGVAQGRIPLTEGVVAHVVAEHGLVCGALRQTARVVEQVAHRDGGRCRLISHAEGREGIVTAGASRSTFPSSTSCMIARAVKDLEAEARMNGVCGVTARPEPSATPKP